MPFEGVTILCSGVALGVYVPGLLLGQSIQKHGLAFDVCVLETLFGPAKLAMVERNKKAFHESFRVALMGQKIPNDIGSSVDNAKKEALFSQWKREGRSRFIVLTGFWLGLVEEYLAYAQINSDRADITILHMDAEMSVSWKSAENRLAQYPNTWIFAKGENGLLKYRISIEGDTPLPFSSRSGRFVIHGGGWGMGTYRENIAACRAAGLPLDIILYDWPEYEPEDGENRQFILDPGWKPWMADDSGRHCFPRFGAVKGMRQASYVPQNRHALYSVVCGAAAIISKPGGGTLVDSFASATPVLFLEPFGGYENANMQLWRALGYGIGLQEFIQAGCDFAMLQSMHEKILADRVFAQDYGGYYAAQNKC